MADPQEYLDGMISRAEHEGERYIADDSFAPANDRGESDLNVHGLDMVAEPDPTQDPYFTPQESA